MKPWCIFKRLSETLKLNYLAQVLEKKYMLKNSIALKVPILFLLLNETIQSLDRNANNL